MIFFTLAALAAGNADPVVVTLQAAHRDFRAQRQDQNRSVPRALWPHLPRFMKALARRLEKVPGNVKRDTDLARRVAPFAEEWARLASSGERPAVHPELDRLQWMIEEFRVQLFAQELRTALAVSEKRLDEQLVKSRAEARTT